MHIGIYIITFADGISQSMFILKQVKNYVLHFELVVGRSDMGDRSDPRDFNPISEQWCKH